MAARSVSRSASSSCPSTSRFASAFTDFVVSLRAPASASVTTRCTSATRLRAAVTRSPGSAATGEAASDRHATARSRLLLRVTVRCGLRRTFALIPG